MPTIYKIFCWSQHFLTFFIKCDHYGVKSRFLRCLKTFFVKMDILKMSKSQNRGGFVKHMFFLKK